MGKREYINNYASVTQVLNILRKPGLEQWFLSNTRAYCTEKSNKGKLVGTQIHDAIQSFIETGKASISTEHDVEVTNTLKSFMMFREEKPEHILRKAEMALTSEVYKFNGTIDCIGDYVMWDWKTGEAKKEEKPKIYDEWKYQVAAYIYLYNEVHNANIMKAKIVALAKDKIAYDIYEMEEQEINDCFHKVFLPCLSILNYQNEQKKKKKEGIFYVEST